MLLFNKYLEPFFKVDRTKKTYLMVDIFLLKKSYADKMDPRNDVVTYLSSYILYEYFVKR